MNDFKTALMIDKIKSQKYGKGLVEDLITIKNWFHTFCLSPIGSAFHTPLFNTPVCNAYKCVTLAISRYIAKCSSPLPIYIYKMKHNMEGRILSEGFLNTDKPTYEWLIDTFQYAADIPASMSNSIHTQISGKQVCVMHNLNYAIFNKLALLIKDKTIPFTINFNSHITEYYNYLTPGINEELRYTMAQLILIQTLKARADNKITYTLFEEALNEKSKELLAL